MGKLSLYKSRQYYKRKNKKYTPGRPIKKQRRFPQKNKDIDTRLSYSDNFENESTSGIMSHAMNFYCRGDPPCDSLLAGHRNSENSTSSSETVLFLKVVVLQALVKKKMIVQMMSQMCGTVIMPGVFCQS